MFKFIILCLSITVFIPLLILGGLVGCDKEVIDTTHLTPTEITFFQTYDLLAEIKITINENKDHKQSTQWRNTYAQYMTCLLYTSPSPRDRQKSRMPSSA